MISVMMLLAGSRNETKSVLQKLLKNESLHDFDYELHGQSAKGDGFMGDINFIEITAEKHYNLVIKCSKTSEVLRKKSPVKEAFKNEVHFYNNIFPVFFEFQKSVQDPFRNVPKCYGTFVDTNCELIALENLKARGYELWDKTKALTRPQIELVVEAYAKLHATSLAFEEQKPKEFQELLRPLYDVLDLFAKSSQMIESFAETVRELCSILKNDLDEADLQYWNNLADKVPTIFKNVTNREKINVISHGDCWNNNFMYLFEDNKLKDVIFLDFQITKYRSPVCDLSYFLFSCISEEDLNELDVILRGYHNVFLKHLSDLGSSPTLYSFDQFWEDWRDLAKFGIVLSSVIHNFSLAEKEDVPDMAEAAETGDDVMRIFSKTPKNVEAYRERMKYIVKFATSNKLI